MDLATYMCAYDEKVRVPLAAMLQANFSPLAVACPLACAPVRACVPVTIACRDMLQARSGIAQGVDLMRAEVDKSLVGDPSAAGQRRRCLGLTHSLCLPCRWMSSRSLPACASWPRSKECLA